MVRKSAWLGWLGLLLLPAAAHALGLGEIRLNSALNQPLRAEIELLSATTEELAGLKAQLASRDAFARYGLERPQFLSDLRFRVTSAAGGGSVLQISSEQAITEPFVTFLIEVNWARGRLLREYTVLLDPPTFMPGERQASQPVAAPTRDTADTIRREAPRPPAQPPAPVPGSSRSAAPAPRPVEEGGAGERIYRVNRNDTLWRIANDLRPAGVDVNQMMITLYQQNPAAFYGNINLLKAGALLQLPDPAAIGVGSGEAQAEVRRQTDAWRSARGTAAEPARLRLVAADEPADSGTALPSPGTTGSATAGDAQTRQLQQQVSDLERELADSRRLLDLRDDQLAELQRQLAAAGQQPLPGDALPPVDVPTLDEPLADQAPVDTLPGDEPSQADAEPEPVAAQPEPAPPPSRVVTQAPQPSFIDRLIGHVTDNGSLYLIGLGALALIGGGLVFLRRRRESDDLTGSWEALSEQPEEEFEAPAPVADREPTERLGKPKQRETFLVEEDADSARGARPAKAAGPAALPAAKADSTLVELDKNDPLAEADFHMAYGLYDQAADLVNLAIQREPDRRELKLKLLEIYFVWGNKEAFLETARELHEARDDAPAEEWDKILIMGKQICPEELLFQEEPGSGVSGGGIDVELAGGQATVDLAVGSDDEERGLDFDLAEAFGTEAGETQETNIKTSEMSGIDFSFDLDSTAESPTVEQPGSEAPTVQTRKVRDDESPTMETPTIETPRIGPGESGTVRMPSRTQRDVAPEQTAEIELDALGLDLDELEATGRRQALKRGADEPNRSDETVIGQFPLDEDDESTGTIVLGDDEFDPDRTANVRTLTGDDDSETTAHRPLRRDDADEVDVDLDHLGGGEENVDTVRRPEGRGEVDEFADVFDAGPGARTGLDHDFGDGADDDVDFDIGTAARDDDGAQTEELPPDDLEPATMSEVGTKLDLARAYMDMGDPDGARSILQEVLEEGNDAQRRDAEKLMNALP